MAIPAGSESLLIPGIGRRSLGLSLDESKPFDTAINVAHRTIHSLVRTLADTCHGVSP